MSDDSARQLARSSSPLSRRRFVATAAAAGALTLARTRTSGAAIVRADLSKLPPYGLGTLPARIRSRIVPNINGIDIHLLEAGYEGANRPGLLLLHGFPELAYSWRKVIVPLADAGYHVIVPDMRGFGRTMGWDDAHDANQHEFRVLNMVRDNMMLLAALGHRSVALVAGHDAGALIASWSALVRPDMFRSLIIMSTPFPGAPTLPVSTGNGAAPPPAAVTDDQLDAELAKLKPPRKYYWNHQRLPGANVDMLNPRQGLKAFLRGYYYAKSGDWPGNNPHPLKARTAEEMAQVPTYYVMERGKGMAENIAAYAIPPDYDCAWLTDAELGVYVSEYRRTGFNGALHSYRARRSNQPEAIAEITTFANRTIDVPAMFVGGQKDWGTYQTPGAYEAMQTRACSRMVGAHLIAGAGHWVQQEKPGEVVQQFLEFLTHHARPSGR